MGREQKVAVVTGGSRGIGEAVARVYAAAGFDIVLNYREAADRAERVAAALPTECITVQGDVGTSAGAEALARKTDKRFGRADVLINNAGAIHSPAGWQELTDESFRATMAANLASVIFCSRSFIPLMRSSGDGGAIVNVGSTYGCSGAAPVIAYSAAKAGVVAATKSLARELAPEVRVNAVAPSNVDTDMSRAAGDELLRQIVDSTPMGRLGTAAEVAELVLYLGSGRSGYITGQVFVVDGGFLL